MPITPIRRANSLLELMAAVTILGALAAIALPRTASVQTNGNRAACHLNQAEIELQSMLWLRRQGSWPAGNLADIGIETDYFPEGPPNCPVDGTDYTIDSTGKVIGHEH